MSESIENEHLFYTVFDKKSATCCLVSFQVVFSAKFPVASLVTMRAIVLSSAIVDPSSLFQKVFSSFISGHTLASAEITPSTHFARIVARSVAFDMKPSSTSIAKIFTSRIAPSLLKRVDVSGFAPRFRSPVEFEYATDIFSA